MSEFRRSFAETGHTEAERLGQELAVSRADLVLHCAAKYGFGARDANLQVFVAAILSSLRSLKDCSNHEALGSRRPARTTWSGGLQSASGASIWASSQSEDFVLRTSPEGLRLPPFFSRLPSHVFLPWFYFLPRSFANRARASFGSGRSASAFFQSARKLSYCAIAFSFNPFFSYSFASS